MVLDPSTGPTSNRVVVVDNRTCNVYSVPSDALKVPCASPAVVDMEELQTLVETQQFSIGAVLKHVRGKGSHAFTDDHVGIVGHGANNAWVSRVRVKVSVAHPVVAACLRHETVEVQDEFRRHPPDHVHLGEELHWIWSQRLAFRSALHRAEARRKCDCPSCTQRYSHAIDAFPISMDADHPHGAFDVASIPGAVLVPHSALPVGVRMFLLTAAEPQPGAEARETSSTKRDGFKATASWREETLKRIDSNAAVASDRLVAYCRANGVPPCVGVQMLVDANASYRAKTVALRLQERSRVALHDDISMHVVELYNAHPTVFPHPKRKLEYGIDELDQHRKRGLATAWPACADPSDSKRQRKEASVWLPEELWGRIFAIATAEAMHEETSARAVQDLRALSLTNRLGRDAVYSVVAAGVRAAAAAIVVCDQRRGEDAVALLGAVARAAVQPVETPASATYAGVLFRNIGLPIDAVYWMLRENPTDQEQRAVQMLRDRDNGRAFVWYRQWRKARLSVYNGRVDPCVAAADAETLGYRRLRWRGVEAADEEPEPEGMARADAAPRNVRADFMQTVLTPFGVA